MWGHNIACATQRVGQGELLSLLTAGQIWSQDCNLGSYQRETNGRTALLRDFINLSANGASFLCLIKIWNAGCDLSLSYDSLPPGSGSQRWRCQDLWCRMVGRARSIPGVALLWASASPRFLQWEALCLLFSNKNTFHFINKHSKNTQEFLHCLFSYSSH